MEPPWQKHPNILAGSIGWRMGSGEEYYNQFYQWFSALSPADQDDYVKTHAAPAGWTKLYETIRKHPWG